MRRTGTHIVWIHGWASSAAVWHPVIQLLPEQTHTCFSYGESADIDIWRADLRAAVQPGSLVVGWSLGGMLALESATGAAGLVLIGGTQRFVHESPEKGWPLRVLTRMQRRLGKDPDTVIQNFSASMFTSQDRKHLKAHGLSAPHTLTDSAFSLPALAAGLSYLAESDLTEALATLACPVLWLHGTHDPICPPAAPKPGCVQWLEGAGHAPHLVKPQWVADHILEFSRACNPR